ncbi:MAG: hypothetical protein RLY97_2318 [Pseudomonadota bacterium]|jgi:hypothetical protein
MDIGFSSLDWQHGTPDSRGGQEIAAPLDWHGLTARLSAALACRQAMAVTCTIPAPASFDAASALRIAAYNDGTTDTENAKNRNYESAVNLNISAIGKPPSVIEAALPAQTRSAFED